MPTALAAALVYGLTGGLAPGPLLTLVVSQTLRHGAREGMKTALAPLITDGPIIVLLLLFLDRIAVVRPLLLVYLTRESWSAPPPSATETAAAPRSLLRVLGKAHDRKKFTAFDLLLLSVELDTTLGWT